MEITEIRITEMRNDRLKAFASVTFDGCFVIHDIKIVESPKGLLVCMPSKKAQIECADCGQRISSGSLFCPMCGKKQMIEAGAVDKKKSRRDIAHPINDGFRVYVSDLVLASFSKKTQKEGGKK